MHYNNNGSYVYQRHQYPAPTYYSYPTVNPVSSSCLTQVLTTHASGATVLCLDHPKEKQSIPVTSRVRIFGLAAVLCLALLGATTCLSMDGAPPLRPVEKVNFTARPQNSSRIHPVKPQEKIRVETSVPIQLPINRVIYSFDFDDSDPHNEARVETLRW